MTEWERQREREQFSRTSRVYQPLSVSLNTRFTREGSEGDKKKSEVCACVIIFVCGLISYSSSPRNRTQSRLPELTCLVF